MSAQWDAFVAESRNATFLFKRGYMDYHSHRFTDCSLMAYRRGKLAALLPANVIGTALHSHQGLTYGGWCLPQSGIDGSEYKDLWETWLGWCADNGISEIIYKPLPYIYQTMPSQEELYMLSLHGTPLPFNLASTVDLGHNPGFNKLQRRHLSHSPQNTDYRLITAGNTEGIEEFHKMLQECLATRHDASPVHSREELTLLMERFPDNIQIAGAYTEERMQAGICLFLTPMCMHCQYIATTAVGREQNLLPGLVKRVMEASKEAGIRYLDFGTSNEEGGRILNAGLNRQKTAMGGSGVAYQRWIIKP